MESRWREGKHQNSDGEDNEERDPVKVRSVVEFH